MSEDLTMREKVIVAAIGSLVDDLVGGFDPDSTSVEAMQELIQEAVSIFEASSPQEQHDAEEIAKRVIASIESVVSVKH